MIDAQHFTKSLYLTSQVPIPAFVLFSRDLGAAAKMHYAKLRILAYANSFDHTDLIASSFLCEYLEIDESTLSRTLQKLVRAEAINLHRPKPGYLIVLFVNVPDGDVYLLPDHTLTNKPDIQSEILAAARQFDNKLNPRQMYAYIQLTARGVYAAPAYELSKRFDVLIIMEHCERYDWAKLVGLAKHAGWLRKSIAQQWDAPTGYVVPADRCPECGHSITLGAHAKKCRHSWNSIMPYIPALDCPTCGGKFAEDEHLSNCWRKKFDFDFAVTVGNGFEVTAPKQPKFSDYEEVID